MSKKAKPPSQEIAPEYKPTVHMNLPTKGVKVSGVEDIDFDKGVTVMIHGRVTGLRQEDYGNGKEFGVTIELKSAEFKVGGKKTSLKDAIASADVRV